MTTKKKCPFCHEIVEMDERVRLGQRVVCPHCYQTFSFGAPPLDGGKSAGANNRKGIKLPSREWFSTFSAVLAALLVFSIISNFPGCHINVNTEYTNGGVQYR